MKILSSAMPTSGSTMRTALSGPVLALAGRDRINMKMALISHHTAGSTRRSCKTASCVRPVTMYLRRKSTVLLSRPSETNLAWIRGWRCRTIACTPSGATVTLPMSFSPTASNRLQTRSLKRCIARPVICPTVITKTRSLFRLPNFPDGLRQGDLPMHHFVGGNVWMTNIINGQYGVELNRVDQMNNSAAWSEAMLQQAAEISIEGLGLRFRYRAGQSRCPCDQQDRP